MEALYIKIEDHFFVVNRLYPGSSDFSLSEHYNTKKAMKSDHPEVEKHLWQRVR